MNLLDAAEILKNDTRLAKKLKRTILMELTAPAGMLSSLTPENRPTVYRHAGQGLRESAHRH